MLRIIFLSTLFVAAIAGSFTLQEKARFLLQYERAQRNYDRFEIVAKQDLRSRAIIPRTHPRPDSFVPPRTTLQNWCKLFEETGCLERRPYRRENPVLNNETLQQIDDLISENPRISQRRIANELGISLGAVNNALKKLNYHPYKIQLTQELQEEDLATRLEFCRSQLDLIESGELDPDDLLFSDEANFHLTGEVNRHNIRCYAKRGENPGFTMERPIQSPKINVWAGVTVRGVVGPFFFLQTSVNGERYATLLEGNVAGAIDSLYHEARENETNRDTLIFQQDGAPPHFGGLPWLEENFPGKWMGRGTRQFPAPYPWPARSPDLTVMDFWFWGYLKSKVYDTTPYANKEDLMHTIRDAVAEIPLEMVQKSIRQGYVNRLKLCVLRGGRQVEPYENEGNDESGEESE